MRQTILIILTLLLGSNGLLAIPSMRKYQKLSTGKGLPHIYVDCLFQKDDGKVWIATHKGIVKYDGEWLQAVSVSDSLSHPHQLQINCFAQVDDRVLLASNNGLLISTTDEDTIKTCLHRGKVSELVGIDTAAYFLSKEKLMRWDTVNSVKELTVLQLKEPITRLFLGPNQTVCAVTKRGWGVLKGNSDTLSYILKGRVKGLRNMMSDSRGRIWGVSDKGIWSLYPDQRLIYKGKNIQSITESVGGFLMAATYEDGLYDLIQVERKWTLEPVHTVNDGLADGYFDKRIKQIFTDSSGAIWIATNGNGVNILMDDGQWVNHARHQLTDKFAEYGYINSLAETLDQELLVGTSGRGLLRWDEDDNSLDDVLIMNDTDTLKGVSIDALTQSPDGKLWMGTRTVGILVATIDDEYKKIEVESIFDSIYLKTAYNPSINEFVVIDSLVVANTSNGIFGINWKNKSIQTQIDPMDVAVYINDTIKQNRNTLFFESGRVIKGVITHLAPDSTIWYGNSSGLFRIMSTGIEEHKMFSGITDVVTSITSGLKPFLWIGTRNGIIKYNPDTHVAVRYQWGDKQNANSFNPGNAIRLRDGRLAYGSNDGIVVCDPAHVYDLPEAPTFLRKEEHVEGYEFEAKHLCYNFSEKCLFKYCFAGRDTLCGIERGTTLRLDTKALQAGNYKLFIEVFNGRGEPVGEPMSVDFKLKDRHGSQWLVIIAVVIVVLLMLFVFWWLRRKPKAVVVVNGIEDGEEENREANDELGKSRFLEQAEQIVLANIASPTFSVINLYEAMQMSKSNFYRRLKNEKDISPNEFIRQIRLERAAELLKNKEISVNEVAYETGFNTPSYFSRCFKQQFFMTPKEYQQQQH